MRILQTIKHANACIDCKQWIPAGPAGEGTPVGTIGWMKGRGIAHMWDCTNEQKAGRTYTPTPDGQLQMQDTPAEEPLTQEEREALIRLCDKAGITLPHGIRS
jgi:hypothetical protein